MHLRPQYLTPGAAPGKASREAWLLHSTKESASTAVRILRESQSHCRTFLKLPQSAQDKAAEELGVDAKSLCETIEALNDAIPTEERKASKPTAKKAAPSK